MDQPFVVRSAGRRWTSDDLLRLRALLADQRNTLKEIAIEFGIKDKALTRPEVRKTLGYDDLPKRPGGNNNRGRLPIPPHAHPLVRKLYRIMNIERTNAKEVSIRAGLCAPAVGFWKHQNPHVHNLEAAFNVVGYRLVAVQMGGPMEERDEE